MSRKKTAKLIIIVALVLVVSALFGWLVYSNLKIELNTYKVESDKIPEAFDGYRIVQVSDVHNGKIFNKNQRLFEIIRKAEPDIIAVTGDLLDSRHTDVSVALEFMEGAVEIAPCYYVTGNHEARVPEEFKELRKGLEGLGVVILEDEVLTIGKGDSSITLMGISDPRFTCEYIKDDKGVVEASLGSLNFDKDSFSVLLSHRPEMFELYVQHDFDLVLSGHAHGGQVRLPFAGGVYAPSQGLFPQYDAGLFAEDNTKMIVSRGVGNSLFPLRVGNSPEVVVAELESK